MYDTCVELVSPEKKNIARGITMHTTRSNVRERLSPKEQKSSMQEGKMEEEKEGVLRKPLGCLWLVRI